MHIISVMNVNQALSEGLNWLAVAGIREQSRNGAVIAAPGPVMTEYYRPCERVLFNAERNANPYFHLMEALWMLGGRNDVAWPQQFNHRFGEYSDDGKTIHGAYGYRWRTAFKFDQVKATIELLRRDPETRRAVIGVWQPEDDLGSTSKDIPCNTHIYFDLRRDKLNMTVLCRSNDIIWGAYGANVVHMSILQEFIAAAVGRPVGVYRQYSNNYHLYTQYYDVDNAALRLIDNRYDAYGVQMIKPLPLVNTDFNGWLYDLREFMLHPLASAPPTNEDTFFTTVARPMYHSWMARKNGGGDGLSEAREIAAPDWRTACVDWIGRAEERRRLKNDKGE